MIAVALKGLAGRKVRALLTALAVVIGVSMVSGTFILTDTMQKTFDGLFTASYDKTDAVIKAEEVTKGTSSGATIPASVLTQVKALDEVGAASGVVSPDEVNAADIIGEDGESVARESIGTSVDAANPQFTPLKLKAGHWAEGPEQVVIDAGTAKKEHYAVGDDVKIATGAEQNTYEVSGIASFGEVDSLGFGSIAAWDVKTAQSLLDREGRYDSISIAAKEGTSPAELVSAVKPLVGDGLAVQDSAKQAEQDSAEVNESMSYIRYFLLGFAGIALLVGAFVIYNTLSITVAQRTREFATLRTLGASRKQVMRSVRIEGFVIGLLASVLGLLFGIGIAKGMVMLFAAMGVDLPEADTVIAGRTVLVSLLVGTTVTLIASIVPARKATRVPPIAAVREGAALPPSRFAKHSLKAGLVVLGASMASILAGIFAAGVSPVAVALLLVLGVLGLFLGIAWLAPRMVKPLAHVVGWPARKTAGVAGELAGANAVRNPRRTASTAAALMIGLTLVTFVAVLGSGMRASTESAVKEQLTAPYVVSGKDDLPFRADEGARLAAMPGVQSASHVRADTGGDDDVTGVDPATIARFYAFDWADGSSEKALDQLGADGAIVSKAYAEDEGLKVGDAVSVKLPSGERSFTVRGIHEPPAANPLLNKVTIGHEAYDAAFKAPKNQFTFLDAGTGAETQLKAEAKGFGDASVNTGAGYVKESTKDLATFLSMLYVLLGFSVVVSLFGMVNTLVLSVFERTRELGMLRAIGMTRRQSRRMIRHESVITALIGAALGLSLGVFLAALVTQALSKYGISLVLPWTELVAFTVIAVLAGIGAAVMPARRASKLDVLEALHYE
jgi:putative ABC transport system permease protein